MDSSGLGRDRRPAQARAGARRSASRSPSAARRTSQRILELSGLTQGARRSSTTRTRSWPAGTRDARGGRGVRHPRRAAAGGEVGRDLARRRLGGARRSARRRHWPRSLQTVVQVLLTSRFAMWMAWGPELTFFCNDAYRRDTLGKKYPWALGRPAREVWAEIWPDIGPRIETVLRTGVGDLGRGAAAVPRAQRLRRGDLPHVLLQPAGRRRRARSPGCCASSARTPSGVIGERRLATLRDLGAGDRRRCTEAEVLAPRPRHLARQPARRCRSRSPTSTTRTATPRACAARPGSRRTIPSRATTGLARRRRASVELAERADLPTGAWDEPPSPRSCSPLPHRARAPLGFLVAGLNRYRAARRRATAPSSASSPARSRRASPSARAYEAERRRAEALAELDRRRPRSSPTSATSCARR